MFKVTIRNISARQIKHRMPLMRKHYVLLTHLFCSCWSGPVHLRFCVGGRTVFETCCSHRSHGHYWWVGNEEIGMSNCCCALGKMFYSAGRSEDKEWTRLHGGWGPRVASWKRRMTFNLTDHEHWVLGGKLHGLHMNYWQKIEHMGWLWEERTWWSGRDSAAA